MNKLQTLANELMLELELSNPGTEQFGVHITSVTIRQSRKGNWDITANAKIYTRFPDGQ